MKKINKKERINILEKFTNKIFKNGEKYKFFKILKNNMFLLNFLKNKLKIKKFFLKPFLIDETYIKKFYPNFSYKTAKEKKKKILNVSRVNTNNSNELFKWTKLILFKLKIRTIKARLLYYIFSLILDNNIYNNLIEESQKDFKKNISINTKIFK